MSNSHFDPTPRLVVPQPSNNQAGVRQLNISQPTPLSAARSTFASIDPNSYNVVPTPQVIGRTSSLPPHNHQAGARQSNASGAIPSAEYSWRAPSPPHIHVPQAPDDRELTLAPYYEFQCKPEHKEILLHITQGPGNSVISRDWKYEWRRQAQQMTKSLYLGPSNAARDVDTLRDQGVTLLLAIRDSTMAMARFLSGEKVANQLGIEADSIDVAGNPQLIAGFPQAIEKINDHLVKVFQHRVSNGMSPDDPKARGKVLVFCESGNERSATIVAAYLMHMHNLNEIQAIQYIQTQRFCVAFDDALKHLLISYRELLRARENVWKAIPRSPMVSKAKRGRDDMDMDDMDLGAQQDDVERFGKRSVFTPFH